MVKEIKLVKLFPVQTYCKSYRQDHSGRDGGIILYSECKNKTSLWFIERKF